jgi:hypothetical protein
MDEPASEIDIDRLTGCLSKTPFESRSDAKAALKRIERRKENMHTKGFTKGKVDIYKCRYCEKFHHGHDIPSKFRARRNIRIQ